MTLPADAPRTPDGRYLIVRGRLWRATDPALGVSERQRLVERLMNARRGMRRGGTVDAGARAALRSEVDAVKQALGERGPVWWSDGAPDYNRHLVRNTPYAGWYAALAAGPAEP